MTDDEITAYFDEQRRRLDELERGARLRAARVERATAQSKADADAFKGALRQLWRALRGRT